VFMYPGKRLSLVNLKNTGGKWINQLN